ncbi:MAG: hypothetical protein SGJ23_07865 [Alphaproteobacteria bacterium]|nr:hypothetical protein [Alphaproteobacteria bacterium]
MSSRDLTAALKRLGAQAVPEATRRCAGRKGKLYAALAQLLVEHVQQDAEQAA